MGEPERYAVDYRRLPPDYPTQAHPPALWEALGRTVATFGFLEEALAKAVFAFTGMRQILEENAEAEYRKWFPTLEKALTDTLGGLIDTYGKAVRSHDDATIGNFDQLLDDLRAMSGIRNALCHGSWNRRPDADGRSVPFFVNRKQEKFELALNAGDLRELQRKVLKLTCDVINNVTYMGWQFPGSTGPGHEIWPSRIGKQGKAKGESHPMDSRRARQLFADYDAAMAYIDVELPDGERGIGSAFHVGEGVFVTARHVVSGNKILEVRVTEPLSLTTLDYFVSVEGYPDSETRAAQYDAAFTGSNVSPPLWKHYLPPLSITSGPHFAAENGLDVAVFRAHNIHPATPVLLLGNHWDDWVLHRTWHLSDAIILGYPPIPMSQSPVLVAARAEIHTHVVPRHVRALHFILSATPRGGFSGGVAIHEDGYVLGVVTSSMVESGQAPELGFFAVLSTEAIVGCLAEHNLLPEVQKKNFDDLQGFDTGRTLKAIGEMTATQNRRMVEGT